MSTPIKPLKVLGDVASVYFTGGLVDVNKQRMNAPFSSSHMRTYGKSFANAYTLGLVEKDVNKALDSSAGRTAGSVIGGIAAAVAGGAAGGALAGGSAAAGGAAGAASGSGAAAATGATAGTTLGISNAAIGTVAGATTGYLATQQMGQADQAKAEKKALQELEAQSKRNAPPPLPSLTNGDSLRRRRSFSTLLTSPYGVTEQANVQKPTLGGRRTLLG